MPAATEIKPLTSMLKRNEPALETAKDAAMEENANVVETSQETAKESVETDVQLEITGLGEKQEIETTKEAQENE